MGAYSLLTPRLFWDTSFAKVIDIGYPLDNVSAGPVPREGSSWVQGASAVEDAWIVGTDSILEGDLRWIPGRDAISPKRTGWDGLNNDDGVSAFLTWARDKNTLRYHPNGRNLLVSPLLSTDTDANGVANDWTGVVDPGAAATFSMDGANSAQVITATASTAVAQAPRVEQIIPAVMPNEVLTASVEAMIDAPIANGAAALRVAWRNAAGTVISTTDTPVVSATAFGTRVSVTATAPALTASARIECRIRASAAGLSGVARFRQVMVRRDSTDTSFNDNPSWSVYLVEPMQGLPTPERDGSRIIRLRFRQSGAGSFTDY